VRFLHAARFAGLGRNDTITMPHNHTIISLGGSLVIPKIGFDIPFLKRFRKLILDEMKRGKRFILIVGGGATARAYQEGFKDLWIPPRIKSGVTEGRNDMKLDDKLDWLGIHSTILNAQFVRMLFGDNAYHDVQIDPTKKIKTDKPIIIGSGWKPGCSSDYDAVLAAKTYGAREVINISNIDYVYDKDPTKFTHAKPLPRLTWKEYRAMVGDTWYPGSNAPFDPIASKTADKLGLTVKILRGTALSEARKAIRGEKFRGTTIA